MTKVTITLRSADPAQTAHALRQLHHAGVRVEQTFDTIGLVVGTVADNAIETVRRLSMVAAVEADRAVRAI